MMVGTGATTNAKNNKEEETCTCTYSQRVVLLQASIECNNIGVALLLAGRIRESLETFKGATEIISATSTLISRKAAADEMEETACARQDSLKTPAPFASALEQTAKAVLKQAQQKYAVLQRAPQSSGLIMELCSDPILIDPLSTPITSDPDSCILESAVIVYNLGLNYQVFGSIRCLEKALQLYDMAHSLTVSAGSVKTEAIHLAVACMNNIGVIHYTVGDYTKTKQCMDYLALCLSQLPLPRNVDNQSIAERQRLCLNVLLLQEPTCANAA